MSSERRRNDLPLSKKYEAVMMLKEKISQSAVARKLKCSQSQISRITSKQEEIIAAYKSDSNPDRKRQRVGHEPKIEEALTQWFVGARSKEIPLTGTMIAEQAKKIANEFDQKQFVPTSGWLSRWKDRNNVRWDLKKRCLHKRRNRSSKQVNENDVDNESQVPSPSKIKKPVATGKNGIKDVFCDPDNPRVLQFQDVSAAAYKIKDGIQKTPCTKSRLSGALEMDLFFKKEFLQFTGSFKERGARYTLMMLPQEQKTKGVIAASAGNHALALAYHGHDLGIPVTVVMPIIAPMMKIQACKSYGATVIVKGDNISESKDHAMKLGKQEGKLYINGYDHPHILAGQGTIGLEIIEQVPDLDACIIPIGGAGLIAGAALAIKNLKPDVQIIGVESERCPSFTAALKADKPVFTPTTSGLADGLAVPTVGVNAFATAKSLIDKTLIVKEEFIALAILRLIELEKAVVEGAGATGLAAVIQGLLPELKGKKVVIILCGGNIDTTALGRVIERGLAADHRLLRFVVTVSDRPGGIAELTKLMSDLGISIKDIFHERAWLKTDVFSVQVKCVVESRDAEHAQELEMALRAKYSNVFWGPQNAI